MSLRTSENQTTHDAAYGTEGESTHIYVHIPHYCVQTDYSDAV